MSFIAALFFRPMRRIIPLILLILSISIPLKAQQQSRIRCDFSVKTKIKGKAEARLVMGTCYYDLRTGRILYELSFPQKERWIFVDSVQWIVRNDSVIAVEPSNLRPELSVLHLSLTQELSHYGLKNSIMKPTEVVQDKGMVITTWLPPSAAQKRLGKVATSTKNKQLQGVLFYHPSGRLMRKQLFGKYQNIQGTPFPTEVIDIVWEGDREIWQQTNYSKIIINDPKNDDLYQYMPRYLPSGKMPARK